MPAKHIVGFRLTDEEIRALHNSGPDLMGFGPCECPVCRPDLAPDYVPPKPPEVKRDYAN